MVKLYLVNEENENTGEFININVWSLVKAYWCSVGINYLIILSIIAIIGFYFYIKGLF